MGVIVYIFHSLFLNICFSYIMKINLEVYKVSFKHRNHIKSSAILVIMFFCPVDSDEKL